MRYGCIFKWFSYLLFGIAFMVLSNAYTAELIVLAAPVSNDDYYHDVEENIIDFQINYAKKIIANGDDVLILSDRKNYSRYHASLDSKHILLYPMDDIWMRDFTIVNPLHPVMFRYTAEGQGSGIEGQAQADEVQDNFLALAKKAKLSFTKTDLLNDGGNFVSDEIGNAVISRKFLRDNHLSEKEARKELKSLMGLKNIAFIEADEQVGLEHADGIVSFVENNVLVINAYPEDKAYSKELKSDLQNALPGVEIHEIMTPYDGSDIYDSRFGSACGLYTNMLVTKDHIYLPQFGIAEDAIALKQVQALTSKKVIPVLSSQVCKMGGGVRCMSLQLNGENASKLLVYSGKVNKESR